MSGKKKATKAKPSETVQIRAEDKEKFDNLLKRMIEHKPVPKSELRIKRKPRAKKVIEEI